MALWDFLKRKKEVENAKPARSATRSVAGGKPTEKKVEKVSVPQKIERKEGPTFAKASVAKGFSYEVVRQPHISEKATNLAEKNKYVFKVYKNTNKPEIKKAVEGIYGVNVLGVNMIKIPKKKRRLGRTEGFRRGYVKAVVTIKAGQRIELF